MVIFPKSASVTWVLKLQPINSTYCIVIHPKVSASLQILPEAIHRFYICTSTSIIPPTVSVPLLDLKGSSQVKKGSAADNNQTGMSASET